MHPLYLALAFQVLVFLLVYLTEWQYAAGGFIGGTAGCILASLRLQRAAAR